MDFFTSLFDTLDFPRRWDCGLWSPAHGWLHILSDLGVWSAYLAIPGVLGFFLLRKKDVPFRGIFWLFGAFILACGATHLMEAVIFWWPAYRLAGLIKLLTAVVSWATVIALVPVLPRALAMRSPGELERETAGRRRAEEKFRETEERFRQLVENIREIFWMQEGGWERLLYMSPAFEDVWGRTCQSLYEQPRSWIESVPPEDRDLVFAHLEQQERGISTETEFRVVRPDSSVRWMRCRAFPIEHQSGEAARTAGLVEDITERKQAQEALRESEERFRGTFENAAVGIAHVNAQGSILRVNEKLRDIVGYSSAELSGKTLSEVTHPDDLAANLALFAPLMRGELPSFVMEKRFFRKDGTTVWTYLTVSLQRDAAGQPAYCIAIVQDISERKRLEAELRRAILTAEAANRAKDEFLANVSHEIRTPMNAILGMTELALDIPSSEDQRQYLTTVKSAADNLLGMMNDLLDFAKIEAGKLELDRDDFSLRAALADTLRTLAMRATRRVWSCSATCSRRYRTTWSVTRPGCARCCSTWSATPSSLPRRARWSCAWRRKANLDLAARWSCASW